MESGSSDSSRRQWGMLKGVLKLGKNARRNQLKPEKIEKSSSTRQKIGDPIKEAAEPSKGLNESETIVQIPFSEEIGDAGFDINLDEQEREGQRKRESGSSDSAQQQWGVLTSVLKFQRNIKRLHRLRLKPEDIEKDRQILQKFRDSIKEAGEPSKGHNETTVQMSLSEEIQDAGFGVHPDELESEGERGMKFGDSNTAQPNWQLCSVIIGSISLIITVTLKCIPFEFAKKKVVTGDGYEPLPDGPERV